MSEQTGVIVPKRVFVKAPVPSAEEHTVSPELWEALTAEINAVVTRIDAGEELTPEDVKQVRSLKKQVEEYLGVFNKAMRNAQDTYKQLIAKQLDDLGYTKIENYITVQRTKMVNEQNQRLSAKQNKLRELVTDMLAKMPHLQKTALAGELLPAFVHRFPNINSSAKTKEITNWGPYEAVIRTTLGILETFFADPVFEGAMTLPVTSATVQQLLRYVREGDLSILSVMRTVFAKDAEYLKTERLKKEITTKEEALTKIAEIMNQNEGVTPDEKIREIGRIVRIAEVL